MKILLTGNRGYIGSILTGLLLDKGHEVVGYDTDYYRGCEFRERREPTRQIVKDTRDVASEDLRGIDVVIHLAGLSNDPLGNLDPRLTEEINFKASLRLAQLAKQAGIRKFLFPSTCSVYGIANEDFVTETSPTNSLTIYAVSKLKSEEAISPLADANFSPVFLRPGTAYGVSPLIRGDLIINNLVGWAFTIGKLKMLSDGTPWRPLVHVEDIAKGFIACLEAPLELVHNQIFNLGQTSENYQVKDVANLIKEIVPNCEIEYTHKENPDARSFRVDCGKIARVLKDYFHPAWTLKEGIKEVYEAYKKHNLTLDEFTGGKFVRLKQIKDLMEAGELDENLRWKNK